MVKYPRSTHYAEVTVSPAWHQWLRHTRDEPPSVDEQKVDVARQARIKVLAAQADARWEAKPSLTDPPERNQAAPALRTKREEGGRKQAGTLAADVRETMDSGRGDEKPGSSKKESWGVSQEEKEKVRAGGPSKAADPWKRARGPSEDWQPKGWNPSPAPKR